MFKTLIWLGALCFSSANFFSFYWSLKSYFRKPLGRLPWKMQALKLLGSGYALAQLLFLALSSHDINKYTGVFGVLMYLVSLFLFWTAIRANREERFGIAFTSEKSSKIISKGPYALIRHPIYSSYLLTWVAAPIIYQSLVLAIPIVVFFAFYLDAALIEERELLGDPTLKSEYTEYRKHTGMFTPLWP